MEHCARRDVPRWSVAAVAVLGPRLRPGPAPARGRSLDRPPTLLPAAATSTRAASVAFRPQCCPPPSCRSRARVRLARPTSPLALSLGGAPCVACRNAKGGTPETAHAKLARASCMSDRDRRWLGRAGSGCPSVGACNARLVDARERRGARPFARTRRAALQRRGRDGVRLSAGLRRCRTSRGRGRHDTPRAREVAVGLALRIFLAGRTQSPGGSCLRTLTLSAARSSSTSASRGLVRLVLPARCLDEQAGSRAVDRSFDIVRFLNLALILLCVGGAGRARSRVGRESPQRATAALARARDQRGCCLPSLSLAGIGLQGAKASGLGLDAAFRPSLIGDVLDTQFGRVWLLRALLACSRRHPRGARAAGARTGERARRGGVCARCGYRAHAGALRTCAGRRNARCCERLGACPGCLRVDRRAGLSPACARACSWRALAVGRAEPSRASRASPSSRSRRSCSRVS